MLLQYIFKILRKLQSESHICTLFEKLKSGLFDKLDINSLLEIHGLHKWLLEIEEKLYMKILPLTYYDTICKFHIELLLSELEKTDYKFLIAHEIYLSNKESFNVTMNIAVLWNKVLMAMDSKSMAIASRLTYKVFKSINDLEKKEADKISSTEVQGLPVVTSKEIVCNFFKLVPKYFNGFPCDSIITADLIKSLIESSSKILKEAIDFDSIFHIIVYALQFFKEENEVNCFLEALRSLFNYYLTLLKFENKNKNKVRKDNTTNIITLIISAIIINSSNDLLLGQMVKGIGELARANDSSAIDLYVHLFTGNDGNLIFPYDSKELENEVNVAEKVRKNYAKHKQYHDYTLDLRIDKSCKKTEKKEVVTNKSDYSIGLLKENTERHKKDLFSFLVFLKDYRNKCEHKWRQVLKSNKQWRGMWRDRILFDTEEGVKSLPYKMSAHSFSNTARCVTTLLTYTHKYLVKSKLISTIKRFGRTEQYNALLRDVISFNNNYEKQLIQAINLENFPKLLTQQNPCSFLELITPTETKGYKELLTNGVQCELFKVFLIIPGFVLFTINDNEGYIKFVYKDNFYLYSNKVDQRLVFSYEHPSHKKLLKKWCIRDLMRVYKKQIIDEETAIELYFEDGQSVLLNFNDKETTNTFCMKLMKIREKLYKDKSNIVLDGHNIGESLKFTQDWLDHSISTFDYLLYLNSLSSRSFNNISQYPIMPWIIKEYNHSLNLKSAEAYRDLSMPIGMLGKESRTKYFQDKIHEPDITGMGQFNYGSHYSHLGIVLQFMMRVYPFLEAYVEFFTGLDSPNRMFHSMKTTYEIVCTDRGDIRELIPELYCLPEIFINTLESNFGVRDEEGKTVKVSNVLLPEWTNFQPHTFVVKQRRVLESEYVTSRIHQWIDLVFGFKQRGEEAKNAHNVFHPLTTESKEVLSKMPKQEQNEFRFQAFHWGQTPQQLFKTEHQQQVINKKQLYFSLADKNQMTTSSTIAIQGEKLKEIQQESLRISSGYKKSKAIAKIVFISVLTDIAESINAREIRFLMLGDQGVLLDGMIKMIRKGTQMSKAVIFNPTRLYVNHAVFNMYNVIGVIDNPPFIVLRRHGTEKIVQGGFHNGTIKVTSFINPLNSYLVNTHCATITALEANRTEKLLIAGSIIGEIIIYLLANREESKGETGDFKKWTAVRYLTDHTAMVTSIYISDDMQLFATASKDGSANIYTKSTSPKLIRTFRSPESVPILNVCLLLINRFC